MAQGEKTLVDAREHDRQSRPSRFEEKTWLSVPFEDKDIASGLGARFDRQERCWFAPKDSARLPLERWLPAPRSGHHNPKREFARALEDAGLKLDALPIMDGKRHRVPVDGSKRGAKDGMYIGHLDGRPAGYICNHRTGYRSNWRSSMTVRLTPSQREEFSAKQQQRALYRQLEQNRRALELEASWQNLEPADPAHAYLTAKGVSAYGIRQTPTGALIVPMRDVDGRLWSMQKIAPDGTKSFPRDARKSGCFHTIGEVREGRAIMVCEGYATGASLHEATGAPVVVAFDAGNLKTVAMSLRQAHGDRVELLVMADNDHKAKKNVGVDMAREAARAVDGVAVVPRFGTAERNAGLSDWNDIHKARGIGSLREALMERLDGFQVDGFAQTRNAHPEENQHQRGMSRTLVRL